MSIHLEERHSGTLSLVLKKGIELVEGPAVERVPPVARKPSPFANALEVFQSDAAIGALRDGHDLVRYLVIDLRGMSSLLLASPRQSALGATGLLRLQFRAFPMSPPLVPAQLPARIVHPVTGRGKVHHSSVHADEIHRRSIQRLWLYLTARVQEPHPVPKRC